MRNNGNIYLYIIDKKDSRILDKRLVSSVPRQGDELRLGGGNNEQYYGVTHVVWVYDEPETPFERVNIGVELLGNKRKRSR